MTIASDKLFSMTAEIGRGVDKADSRLVTDSESSRVWDRIVSEVSDIKKSGRGVEIPHDPEL